MAVAHLARGVTAQVQSQQHNVRHSTRASAWTRGGGRKTVHESHPAARALRAGARGYLGVSKWLRIPPPPKGLTSVVQVVRRTSAWGPLVAAVAAVSPPSRGSAMLQTNLLGEGGVEKHRVGWRTERVPPFLRAGGAIDRRKRGRRRRCGRAPELWERAPPASILSG